MLHTGDLTSVEALRELEALGSPVQAVHGNVDEPALRELLPERRVVEWKGRRVGLVHDSGSRRGRHERLLTWFPGCDVVAYGHTHTPDAVLVAGTWIVNPGSPTERRRSPVHSMAVVEDGRPRLVTLP